MNSISVVIPTFNGAHKLPNIFKALKAQTFSDFELVVVVDGSTDNTREVLEKNNNEFQNSKVIYQQNGGRANVRNTGAREASGDLLVFFDDDMIPEKDCLQVHIKHHQSYPGTIMTGVQMDRVENRNDFQKYKSYLSKKWSKKLIANGHKPLSKESSFITAANFSISKKLFMEFGGFDERLIDAEDFDLAVRAHQQGINLYYNHAAFAWHNDPITGRSYVKRLRQYRKAHELLRALKPAVYNRILMHTAVLPTGLKRKIFLFFAHKYWVAWLDSKSFFKKLLPRFIRYKVYDLITTANGVYFPEQVKIEN